MGGLALTDAHESANLEMMFAKFTDEQIVKELIRRKRFKVIEYTTTYFKELAEDDAYMAGIGERISRNIANALTDSKCLVVQDIPLGGSPFASELTIDMNKSAVRRARAIMLDAKEIPHDV